MIVYCVSSSERPDPPPPTPARRPGQRRAIDSPDALAPGAFFSFCFRGEGGLEGLSFGGSHLAIDPSSMVEVVL